MNWFVRKWRQWFGHPKVDDYVDTQAKLEAAFRLTAKRAAQAKRDYEEFMRRHLDER